MLKRIAIAIGIMSISTAVFSTESQFDSTSYDKTKIDLTINGGNTPGAGGSILIANLTDLPLGAFTDIADGTDIVGFMDFCVYRTGGGGSEDAINYKLKAENEHNANTAGDAFLLKSGNESLEYTAKHFSDITRGGSSTNFVYDETTLMDVTSEGNGTLTGSEASGYGCTGDNASLEVTVKFADAAEAVAGTYSSTLTLTVEPM